MTIFDGKLYWFTNAGESLMRSALDGTGRAPADPSSLPADVLLALRGGVRLASGDVIYRLDTDPVTGQSFSPGRRWRRMSRAASSTGSAAGTVEAPA